MNDVFADLNRSVAEFAITELDLASTFLDLADASAHEETAYCNRKNARRAYDTVLTVLPKLSINETERKIIKLRLTLLKARLETAGERL